jgi:hypothetical protein
MNKLSLWTAVVAAAIAIAFAGMIGGLLTEGKGLPR